MLLTKQQELARVSVELQQVSAELLYRSTESVFSQEQSKLLNLLRRQLTPQLTNEKQGRKQYNRTVKRHKYKG